MLKLEFNLQELLLYVLYIDVSENFVKHLTFIVSSHLIPILLFDTLTEVNGKRSEFSFHQSTNFILIGVICFQWVGGEIVSSPDSDGLVTEEKASEYKLFCHSHTHLCARILLQFSRQ